MNNLTSRQRKLVYAGCILMLLIPIVYLGAPTSEDVIPGSRAAVSGGVLAQMRVQYDLGESTLGEIDPSSAAMNLVLLGLRGPAAGVLHLQALDYQEKKDWAKLKATVDSIIKLQPHYVEIWKFQGWNLAFNVSREWDRVADRFYWVKEGIKFLQLGTDRNQTATILFHNVGDFMGRKFGSSDEKKFFRKFFLQDPDVEKFDGGADPEINPNTQDNYRVAKDWFDKANARDRLYRVKGMTHVIFRQGPSRALFELAKAQQDDGEFDETNRASWDEAWTEWTEVYGNEIFLGLNDVKYKLSCTEEELQALAKENKVTLDVQRRVWEQNVKMVNFRFWQNLANCERDPLTAEAHRAIYEGKVAYAEGRISDSQDNEGNLVPSEAQQRFEEGIAKLAQVLEKNPDLRYHDSYIEEGMLAVYYWEKVHQYNGKEVPEQHPLKAMVLENAGRQMDIEREFLLENRQGL
ncbi:MAG: hypothetical protein RIK87_00865 [Fuerstiella sp.]